MTVRYVRGDLFYSRAQTLAHGVNCRGRMGAGIALEFRRRYPVMFKEYQQRCKDGRLRPGEYFLWRSAEDWILNLATQDTLGGATLDIVRRALEALAAHYEAEGITSVAMPRIGAGLGGLEWHEVKALINDVLSDLPLDVVVYEEYVKGVEADEGWDDDRTSESGDDEDQVPVLFWGQRPKQWALLSNFAETPFVVDGLEYPTVEHYFQACKAVHPGDHEAIRLASSPKAAKRLGRGVALRPDWEQVKVAVMREGLVAKFNSHELARETLLSTGNRPIHEDSAHDDEWGWMGGVGQDRLGKLLVEVRETLRRDRDR